MSELLIVGVDDGEETPRRRGRRVEKSEESEESEEAEPMRAVTVAAPFRVCYEGLSFFPGDTPVVPAAVAEEWLEAKWVTDGTGD